MTYADKRPFITLRKCNSDERGLFLSLPIAELYQFINENESKIEFAIEGCSNLGEADVVFFTVDYMVNDFVFLRNGNFVKSVLLTEECRMYKVNGKLAKFGLYIEFNKKDNTLDFYDAYYHKDLEWNESLLETETSITQPFILGAILGNCNLKETPKTLNNEFMLDIDEYTNVIRGVVSPSDCLFTRFNQTLIQNTDELKQHITKMDELIGRYVCINGQIRPVKKTDMENKEVVDLKKMFVDLRQLDDKIHQVTINKRIFRDFENISDVQKDIKMLSARRKEIYDKISEIQDEIDKKKYQKFLERNEDILKNHKFKYYSSMCLLIKNENKYLLEWLDHYDEIGVEHFYIYDNGSDIPVSETIAEYRDGYFVDKCTVINWVGNFKHMQHECYENCLLNFGYDNRWIGFVDTDELVVPTCRNIKEFLEEYEDDFCVWIPWEVFNSNGHIEEPNMIQKEAYTQSLPNPFGMYGKVFLQPYRTKKMYVHLATAKSKFDNIVNTDHARHLDSLYDVHLLYYGGDRSIYKKAKVNHYVTRSFEEWKNKIMRGSSDPNFRRKFITYFNYNPELTYLLERQDVRELLGFQQPYNEK